VGIAATAYLWIQDMDHHQYRPASIGKNTCAHTCGASRVTLAPFLTSGKWWPVGQIGTRNSRTVVGIAATAYLWIQDMDYHQYRWATTGKNTRAQTCGASPVTLAPFLTSGKWWPVGQLGTSNSKTVVGIEATAYLWIQDMDYHQYRPAKPFKNKLAFIHLLLQSLWLY
jgi:cysteine sulfinate desulfinase/cysteine desulfurase-like protein